MPPRGGRFTAGPRRGATSRTRLFKAGTYVALLGAASALCFLLHQYSVSHLPATSDDRAYSLQGKAEDLHGEQLAFPGGTHDGKGSGSSGAQLLVLWDTEYTTW